MKSKFFLVSLLGGLAAILALSVEAAPKSKQSGEQDQGYTVRRGAGGYSYNYADSLNTYGRNNHGAASAYADPRIDRQSPGGPFDSGFFFDSAIGFNGGQAPYMH